MKSRTAFLMYCSICKQESDEIAAAVSILGFVDMKGSDPSTSGLAVRPQQYNDLTSRSARVIYFVNRPAA